MTYAMAYDYSYRCVQQSRYVVYPGDMFFNKADREMSASQICIKGWWWTGNGWSKNIKAAATYYNMESWSGAYDKAYRARNQIK